MSQYRYIYFDIKGRGELVRLAFVAADVHFEDVRITFEQWPALKPTMPFGHLPVLEVDGERLAQTRAIGMFLAREMKLAGASSLEEAKVHMLVDTFEDMWSGMPHIAYDLTLSDEQRKEEMLAVRDTRVKPLADKFERNIRQYLSPEGFLIGHSLTLADIGLYWFWDLLGDFLGAESDEWRAKNYPLTEAHYQKIRALPPFVSYRQKLASAKDAAVDS